MIHIKIELFALIITLLLFSCQTKTEESVVVSDELNSSEEYEHFKLDVKKWRKEYLSLDSIKVLGCKEGCNLYAGFDFSVNDSLSIKHPKIILNNKTRAYEIGELFPESCKLTKPGGNTWRGKIEVFASEHDYDHRVWVMVFHNEHLVKVRLYDPFEGVIN